MTYFHAFRHYHRPRKLNDRVRNGNECGLTGNVTGNRTPAGQDRRPHSSEELNIRPAAKAGNIKKAIAQT